MKNAQVTKLLPLKDVRERFVALVSQAEKLGGLPCFAKLYNNWIESDDSRADALLKVFNQYHDVNQQAELDALEPQIFAHWVKEQLPESQYTANTELVTTCGPAEIGDVLVWCSDLYHVTHVRCDEMAETQSLDGRDPMEFRFGYDGVAHTVIGKKQLGNSES